MVSQIVAYDLFICGYRIGAGSESGLLFEDRGRLICQVKAWTSRGRAGLAMGWKPIRKFWGGGFPNKGAPFLGGSFERIVPNKGAPFLGVPLKGLVGVFGGFWGVIRGTPPHFRKSPTHGVTYGGCRH